LADQRPDEKSELLELKSVKPSGPANDTTAIGRTGAPENSVGGGGAAAAANVLTLPDEDEDEDVEEAPLPGAFEYHTDNEDDA